MEEKLFVRDRKRRDTRETVSGDADTSGRVAALEKRLAQLMKGASRQARKRR